LADVLSALGDGWKATGTFVLCSYKVSRLLFPFVNQPTKATRPGTRRQTTIFLGDSQSLCINTPIISHLPRPTYTLHSCRDPSSQRVCTMRSSSASKQNYRTNPSDRPARSTLSVWWLKLCLRLRVQRMQTNLSRSGPRSSTPQKQRAGFKRSPLARIFSDATICFLTMVPDDTDTSDSIHSPAVVGGLFPPSPGGAGSKGKRLSFSLTRLTDAFMMSRANSTQSQSQASAVEGASPLTASGMGWGVSWGAGCRATPVFSSTRCVFCYETDALIFSQAALRLRQGCGGTKNLFENIIYMPCTYHETINTVFSVLVQIAYEVS
jgi:hypothetical protein